MTEAFLFIKPITTLSDFQAAWIPRIPEIDVIGDRTFALSNLEPAHNQLISEQFTEIKTRHHAEQIHGNNIAVISHTSPEKLITHPHVDGLITNIPGQLLAIYIADCAAIYLVDPVKKAISLLHSGKKGTDLNILSNATRQMHTLYGTNPADIICILSPCIRPPDYETDFAATIQQQAQDCGIKHFYDSCENTASDLTRHYSYRLEKGKTGRMLALLSIK